MNQKILSNHILLFGIQNWNIEVHGSRPILNKRKRKRRVAGTENTRGTRSISNEPSSAILVKCQEWTKQRWHFKQLHELQIYWVSWKMAPFWKEKNPHLLSLRSTGYCLKNMRNILRVKRKKERSPDSVLNLVTAWVIVLSPKRLWKRREGELTC